MDELRKDLRAAFERRQTGLGELRGSAGPLIRRALGARDEGLSGRWQVAAGIAAVLIAAMVIATFAYVRGGIGRSNAGPITAASAGRLATPVSSPVPSSPRPASKGAIVDIDSVDASTGWVLLTTCIQPMNGQCHYSVTRTMDGGAIWSTPVRVGPGFDPANGDAPRHVHFINALDGFVYGAVEAYITHDGGHTWGSTGLNAVFFVAATGHGTTAWAVTYPCAKGVACLYQVWSSTNAGRSWSSPYSLPSSFVPSDAIAFSNDGLLISDETSGDLELTLDGATWTYVNAPCSASPNNVKVATPDGNELWQACLEPIAGNANLSTRAIFVSEDGGKSWTRRGRWQVDIARAGFGYANTLVSNRPRSAVLMPDQTPITITHDAGRTWTEVASLGGLKSFIRFSTVTFSNGFDGWALDVNQNIWFTHDGGVGWKQLDGKLIPSAA